MGGETVAEQRPRQSLGTRLNDLSYYSRQRGNKAINLMSLFTIENLSEWYSMLRKRAAAGVDRVTYEEYGENLMENLRGLVQSSA